MEGNLPPDCVQRLLQAHDSSLHDVDNQQDITTTTRSLRALSQHVAHETTHSATTSVRGILSLSSSKDMNRLLEIVVEAMGDRVSLTQVMPLTYDDTANEQAMTQDAMTLTSTSLVAANVYAQLLDLPGALGAGLVEMEGLSALAAVLQRWKVECCGREDTQPTPSKTTTAKHGKRVRENCSSSSSISSPNARPRKSNRTIHSFDTDEDTDEEQTDDQDGVVTEEISTSTLLQPAQLINMGFQVAQAISYIPNQKEFKSWSAEAQEIVVSSVAMVLATSATLATARSNFRDTAEKVVSSAVETLQSCVVAGEKGVHRTTKRHEHAVSMLRVLYPVITMNEVLPNGEAGKIAAASAASQALQGFIKNIVKGLSPSQKRLSYSRRSSIGTTMSLTDDAQTPTKTRRSSIETDSNMGSMTPPKLKGSIMKNLPRSVGQTPGLDRPRPILSAVLGILQKISTNKSLDKASVRTAVVDTVHGCLAHLPIFERAHFLTFLIQLCHSKVSVHRLVGTEIVGRILVEDWLWQDHSETSAPTAAESPGVMDRRKSLSPLLIRSSENMPSALFAALVGRVQDRLPSIRTSSTTMLARVTGKLREEMEASGQEKIIWMEGLRDIIVEEEDSILEVLRKRTLDEKATVRRGAVKAMVEFILLQDQPLTFVDIELLGRLCQDNSVSVRCSAAEGLTRALEKDYSEDVRHAWSSSVLTIILDSEASCSTKGLELAERVLFVPIVDNDDEKQDIAWAILADLCDGAGQSNGGSRNRVEALRAAIRQVRVSRTKSSVDVRRMLSRTVDICSDESSVASSDNNGDMLMGAWCLLEALVSSPEFRATDKRRKVNFDFVGSAWKILLEKSQRSSEPITTRLQRCAVMSLQVLSKIASSVDVTIATKARDTIRSLVQSFSIPSDVVGAAIPALAATMTACAKASEEDVRQCGTRLIGAVLVACEDRLADCLGKSMRESDLPLVHRAIFTIGEISLIGFSERDDDPNSSALKKESDNGISCLRGVHVSPSSKLLDIVQAYAAVSLPGCDEDQTPESVRAHAFITIGKLALRNQTLAKKTLNILARELHENMDKGGSWKVQSNVLLVLGDLCVKFTNMVDKHLPVMAACLQAGVSDYTTNMIQADENQGSAIVRKHSILLLSSLLLQDYIKWRGLLFHRFLVCTADEDDEVAEMAEMLLCGPLISKQPRLFTGNFVEAIFVLNKCTAHPIYVAASAMGDGGSGISVGFNGINLTGEVGRARRMQMYQVMLSQMSDEEKIGVTARIAKEVLGSALETGSDLNKVCMNSIIGAGSINSHENAANVLSDALAVLSDDNMRVGKVGSTGQGGEDEDIEDPNVSANDAKKFLAAKGRLLSNISRKHLIEIMLPILCRLKSMLQKSRSRLLKDLMVFLVGVYRQYKKEVREFLANDPTLLQEIEYDAKHFLKEQQKTVATPGTPRNALTPVAFAKNN